MGHGGAKGHIRGAQFKVTALHTFCIMQDSCHTLRHSFATHQQFLSRFSTAPVAIRDSDTLHPWSYLFDGGHLVSSRAGVLSAEELLSTEKATPPLEAWAMTDRAGVVRRWLAGTETAEYRCLDLSAHDASEADAAAPNQSAAPDAWLPGPGLAIAARRAQQPRRRGHPQPR